MVKIACDLYLNCDKKISEGEYFFLLDRSTEAKAVLDAVKDFSQQHLYCCAVVRERELVGYQVISGILDRFGLLLELTSTDAMALLIEKKSPTVPGMALAPTLCSFLSSKHLKVYNHALTEIITDRNVISEQFEMLEWMARSHLIVDFLSGMTDDFAIMMYRRLYG